ncbi:methionyl-tRNA formyltransferase [Gulosibacter bifidus]|uniref:Methionyl-tRNA formyltransferase n=1 Tax=Gulosibacter bifidus TaxID=272239 RepID=A0ABW5RFL7_9MICO|nr:methionyl-tRNA formyltransferase [Gulosibacter bifidus]
MRIAFAGTPEVAVPTLDALVGAGHDVAVVLTREDAPQGRKRVMTPSAVAAKAEALGIPVVRANQIDDAVAAAVLDHNIELGVVVAYGGIIRPPLLDEPAHGWINLHFSQLPRWRGAAPVQQAIIAGDRDSGVAVFQLEAGLDTGPTYVNRAVPIGAHETAGELLERLAVDGAADVVDVVADLERGTAIATPQSGEVTHAGKLHAKLGRIDWTIHAQRIDELVRGVTPEPGASTMLNGERFKVLRGRPSSDDRPATADHEAGAVALEGGEVRVQTLRGGYVLETVQPAGKRAMSASDWFRGQRDRVVFE